MKRALLLIDLQNDFFPKGALEVKGANEILPAINELLLQKWDLIVASKDWHPQDHGSFAEEHGKKVGDRIQLLGLEQILWPVHCVQKTKGADFAPGWNAEKVDQVVLKGTDREIDSYSAFFDNGHLKETGLGKFLKDHAIDEITIAGLLTNLCVLYSALDAVELGFKTKVILKGCKGIDLYPGDVDFAIERMRNAGVDIV